MNKVLLSVPMFVNHDLGIDETPGVLLALDRDNLRAMINKIEQVQTLKREDRDVYSVSRWAWSLMIYDRGRVADLFDDGAFEDGAGLYREDNTVLTPEQYGKIEDEINKGSTCPDREGADIQVECCQEHYTDDGMYFTAIVRHTSIELESQCLKLDTLKRYLADLEG